MSAFHQALEVPLEERSTFLAQVCGSDADLRREIESLLRFHRAETGRLESGLRSAVRDVIQQSNAAPDPDAFCGRILGHYRIDRKIGEGGMGRVYAAADTRLNRTVAVKLVARDLVGTPGARARFLREARCAAALSHPNIAILHDVGEVDEVPFLVMEYVPGETLRSRLIAGRLEAGSLFDFAGQIVAALDHAHSRRIIHRDIKPENVILAENGTVKVVDFGLARLSSEEPGEDHEHITQPAAFIGTIAYAAPEVLAGGEPSARSDVYSFGVLLHEMAYGQHPFGKHTGPALIAAIVEGRRMVPVERPAALSSGLAGLIDRCLARDPKARFAHGGELGAAFRRIASGESLNPESATEVPSLAVLDFQNLGGDAQANWLGTGIAETLTADLSRLKSVRIASRARVKELASRFGDLRDNAAAMAALGRALEVRWIVTGAYQQSGSAVRVTPRVLDAGNAASLPIGKIDGRWENLFELQDRVVEALLSALAVGFGATDQQKILPAETRNILAYENYARGRQAMYGMNSLSLANAIQYFQNAVELDAEYALAWSGLGTAHALQFLQTTNPVDVQQASFALEKAIELDPELGEPYTWLSHLRVRKNDPEGAIAAGKKAVEMQPDIAEAHYFYGGLHYMIAESHPGGIEKAPWHLAEAIRLQPRFHAAWLGLGVIAMFTGNYEEAVLTLRRAAGLGHEPDLMYRFVGEHSLLGIALMRSGDLEAARASHLNALEQLADSQHIYRDTFLILSACGLGDIELRRGNYPEALTHYRHARRVLREKPRIAGGARLLIRASAGLAAAYAADGDLTRAQELFAETRVQLSSIAGQTMTVTFEAGLGHLCIALSMAAVRIGRTDEAAQLIRQARDAHWMDSRCLLSDPELRPLQGHPVFAQVIAELEGLARVLVPLPRELQEPAIPAAASS